MRRDEGYMDLTLPGRSYIAERRAARRFKLARNIVVFAAILFLALMAVLTFTSSEFSYELVPDVQAEEVRAPLLDPALRPICACESAGDPSADPIHFKDGEVLRGELTPDDVGMCQISLRYWSETASRLGYDVMTEEGNALMANYLYERYGSQPWKASAKCHNK